MKQEDRELLLKDLCARLSYGVSIHTTLYGAISLNEMMIRNFRTGIRDALTPYLRPMSSMTEEEIKEYKHLVAFSGNPNGTANFIDWLNKNHFDYRGLIPKGLAIEVTKENNPYE